MQRWVPLPAPPQPELQPQPPPPPPPPPTDTVLQRARSRLQEAEEAPLPPPRQLRPPVLVMQPADLRAMLGRVAEFCVHAQASDALKTLAPLRLCRLAICSTALTSCPLKSMRDCGGCKSP